MGDQLGSKRRLTPLGSVAGREGISTRCPYWELTPTGAYAEWVPSNGMEVQTPTDLAEHYREKEGRREGNTVVTYYKKSSYDKFYLSCF